MNTIINILHKHDHRNLNELFVNNIVNNYITQENFYLNQRDVGIKKSTTGSQCKPTRNKHGMITRLTC